MRIDEFKKIYNELIEEETELMVENKFLNSLLAGAALTAGTMFNGMNDVEAKPPVKHEQRINKSYGTGWINNITLPFIKTWEGSIRDKNGKHVVYDDNVKDKVKRRWDGKGGQAGIDAFIKSCVGKPTIGYGETDPKIVKLGKIDDSTAEHLLLKKIIKLNNYLNKEYKYFAHMNPNQKTALISFSYNLGKDFIEIGTVKLKAHLKAGRLNQMCEEMRDCDNVKQNGELIKVPGLTRRRLSEMKLFKTPY